MLIIIQNITYKGKINCLYIMLFYVGLNSALKLILCIWYLLFFWNTTTEVQHCQQAPHFSLSTKDRSLIVDEWWTWQARSPSDPVWPWNLSRFWRILTWRHRKSGSFTSTVGQHFCHKTFRKSWVTWFGVREVDRRLSLFVYWYLGVWSPLVCNSFRMHE